MDSETLKTNISDADIGDDAGTSVAAATTNLVPQSGSEGSTDAAGQFREVAFTPGDRELTDKALVTARAVLRELDRPLEAAEDLRQSALLKYFQINQSKRAQLQNKKGYFYFIMRNVVLNQIRSEKKLNIQSLEVLEHPEQQLVITQRSVEAATLLRELWGEIEADDRRLLELMLCGYTPGEVAVKLGISSDAGRKRMSRLRARIKALMGEKKHGG